MTNYRITLTLQRPRRRDYSRFHLLRTLTGVYASREACTEAIRLLNHHGYRITETDAPLSELAEVTETRVLA